MSNGPDQPNDESTLERAKFTLKSVRNKLQQATPEAVRKMTNRIHMRWDGDQRFDVSRPGGPVARIDGTGVTGQGPVDMVLSALVTCVSIDVVEILKKRRTPPERFAAEVSGRRFDGTPRRLVLIQLAFELDGSGLEREHAERAIDLSITKYCSVHDSLAHDIRIEWSLKLNGEHGTVQTDPTRPGLGKD